MKNRRWIVNVKRLRNIDEIQEKVPLWSVGGIVCFPTFFLLSQIIFHHFSPACPSFSERSRLSVRPPKPSKKSIIQHSFVRAPAFSRPCVHPSSLPSAVHPSSLVRPLCPPVTWPRSPAAPASASGPSPPQSGRPRSPAPRTGSELEAAVGGKEDKVLSKRSQQRTHFALILRRQDADVRHTYTHIHVPCSSISERIFAR